VTADGYTIKDLGSGNGTLVNEERIEEAALKDGDRICFGTEYFVFHVND
jgi:pSer/pThr/pTyr-binding forkhead associated (FHA) protein